MEEDEIQDLSGGADDSSGDNDRSARVPLSDWTAQDDDQAQDDDAQGDQADDLPAPLADTAPVVEYQPFVPSGNPYLDRARQKMEDVGLSDIADDLHAAWRFDQTQGFTAQGFSRDYQQQVEAVAPEWTRKHAAAMRRAEAAIAPEAQGTAAAKFIAFAAPAMEHAQRTGRLDEAIAMIQASGRKSAPPPPRTIGRQVNTPSPGAGAASPAPAPRQSAEKQIQRSGSRAAQYLQGLGYSQSDAKDMSRKIEA